MTRRRIVGFHTGCRSATGPPVWMPWSATTYAWRWPVWRTRVKEETRRLDARRGGNTTKSLLVALPASTLCGLTSSNAQRYDRDCQEVSENIHAAVGCRERPWIHRSAARHRRTGRAREPSSTRSKCSTSPRLREPPTRPRTRGDVRAAPPVEEKKTARLASAA